MERVVQIMARGIEKMSAQEIAALVLEQAQEIERLTGKAGPSVGINTEPPKNRVLARGEVLALPNGACRWMEMRDEDSEFNGLAIKRGSRIECCDSPAYVRCPATVPEDYNREYRLWTIGKPTRAESAAEPWKE